MPCGRERGAALLAPVPREHPARPGMAGRRPTALVPRRPRLCAAARPETRRERSGDDRRVYAPRDLRPVPAVQRRLLRDAARPAAGAHAPRHDPGRDRLVRGAGHHVVAVRHWDEADAQAAARTRDPEAALQRAAHPDAGGQAADARRDEVRRAPTDDVWEPDGDGGPTDQGREVFELHGPAAARPMAVNDGQHLPARLRTAR